jgi:hypothetical protein
MSAMNDVIRGIMNFAANLIIGTRLWIVLSCTRRARSGFGPQLELSAYALATIAVGGAVFATLGLGSAIKHTPTLFFALLYSAAG